MSVVLGYWTFLKLVFKSVLCELCEVTIVKGNIIGQEKNDLPIINI